MAEQTYSRFYPFLIYLVLAVSTFVAYEQVRNNDFVYYDDPLYVYENRHVTDGLSRDGIIWAFTTCHTANWYPLTWLSHMLDCQLFGANPGWHHVINVLFHIANTLLLFAVLKRMTGALWCSAFVAAAFALHPLHVESVAWVSEHKDVLSGFFWMLTMWAYVRYTEHPGINRYLLVLLCFVLGLMAKPMLVTLPFVLLLLDYWPLGRLRWASKDTQENLLPAESVSFSRQIVRLTVEKIPLFVLSAASSVVAYIAQHSGGSMPSAEELALRSRIINAMTSYVGYIIKMFYPTRLAVLYPFPERLRIDAALLLIGILVLLSRWARRRAWLTVGLLWYLGTLVPVIGLVQVGTQAMADRYTYLPSIGIFIVVAFGVAELSAKWRYRKTGLGILAGLVLAALFICTRVQVEHWQNSTELFKHAIAVTKNNSIMYNNYGVVLSEQGQSDEAIKQYKEALRINPRYSEAHNNLGVALGEQGHIDEAIERWETALEIDPDYPDALDNLAWALATAEDEKLQNPVKAVEFAEKACRLTDYSRADFVDTLAIAYAAAGKFGLAIETAEKALKLAEATGEKDMAKEIQERLDLYKSGQPYRGK